MNYKYGDVVQIDGKRVFLGTVRLKDLWKYRKEPKVRWWMGTDVLTLHSSPPGKSKFKVVLHRIKTLLVAGYFEENWFVSVVLLAEFTKISPYIYNKIKKPKVKVHECEKVTKVSKPFTVGYYLPEESEFNNWVYGKDIIDRLIKYYRNSDIVFLRYRGDEDIRGFISLINIYIRPSRHDGKPRLILLCEQNDISYCYDNEFYNLINYINLEKKKWEESVTISQSN